MTRREYLSMTIARYRHCPPTLVESNIAYPHPVRTIGNDIELAVGNASEERMAPRIGMIELCRTCPQAVFPHAPLHTFLPDPAALRLQRGMDPRTPIGPTARLIYPLDVHPQPPIGLGARTLTAPLTGMMPGPCFPSKPPTHYTHSVLPFGVGQ